LLPLAASAQSDTAQKTPLDEIVVTATLIDRTLDRVPAAVSVITQDDIQLARQQLALDEALAQVPGLFMQNRYNFAQDLRVSIRGFGSRAQFGIRGIKVLVDGIPETLPDGQGAVDSIDLGATKQIEVIRGPSSSMYGNAAGGVISLTTESAGADPYAEFRVAGGTYDYQKWQFKTGGNTDRLDYMVSVSDLEIDGYRAQSRAVNRQATGRFDLDLGKDRSFLTVVNLTDQPQSDDAGGVTRAQAEANPRAAFPNNVTFHAGEDIEQQRLGFVYTAPAGEHGSIKARNYYAWRDFGNLLPVQNSGIVDLQRDFVGGGFSYNYDGFWLDRPNRLVTGIDFDDQDDDRRRYDNLQGVQGVLRFDQNEHVTSQGVYLQDELSLSKNVQLTMGVRFDQVEFEVTDHYFVDGLDDSGSRDFDNTSPMVGVTFQVAPRLSMYATYSTSFETPTTTEFNKPDGTGGFNQALEPQVAENIEVGLRGALGERQRYEIAVFTIDVKDELIPFEVPTSPGRNYYQNAGKSQHDGIEFSWTANPTDRLQSTVSYAYSDFTFNNGLVIPGTAENTLFAELSYTNPRGWFVAGDALFIDQQYGDNQNSAAGLVDSYTVANLRAGYQADLGKFVLSPFVGVNNLFDESYTANVRLNPVGVGTAAGRYFEQAPTRNAYAGVSLNWKFGS
jgi:iron complex outermembrane receptor protein